MRSKQLAAPSLLIAAGLLGLTPTGHAQQRLSPTDSTETEIAGHRIKVVYGSPSMRERLIFGGLVPWDRVWRTGANEATSLTTEANLRVGDAEVPAGAYTLYTIPGEDEWVLIINRQTGQWGTEYHADMDLARVSVRPEGLEEAVEGFRISLAASGPNRGTLSMEWERTRVSVPLEVIR